MPSFCQQKNTQKEVLISYDTLRKLLGALGVLLPACLIIGSFALHGGILRSISAYYYTPMRDLLVAIFCAIGLFLFTYTGYKDDSAFISENFITNCAGLMAILVALLPTSFLGYSLDVVCTSSNVPCLWNVFGVTDNVVNPENGLNKLLNVSHLIVAMVFFGLIAYLVIWRFTKIPDTTGSRKKERRLYRVCGYTIVACIIMMISHSALVGIWDYKTIDNALNGFPVLFTFESLSFVAFGVAWITKGKIHEDVEKAVQKAKAKITTSPSSSLK